MIGQEKYIYDTFHLKYPKLWYVPLEPLPERYTVQLSAKGTGWLESRWTRAGFNYSRVEGTKLTDNIKHGSVLDANGRGYWACSQVCEILRLIDAGELTSDHVIYFDDFWHPGIEAIRYSFDVMDQKPPAMFAMLHAQSVDQYDFTYKMRSWMRYFEKGIGSILDGIFVTSTGLADLVEYAGIGKRGDNLFLIGLPYNSDEVKSHFPVALPKKKDQVIFSSRWDTEKCPAIFLAIARYVYSVAPDIKFVITTSAKELRSNDPNLLDLLCEAQMDLPNLELRQNQTKEQYYYNLLESKIQINTADQDWVSWTMLEGATCGCQPLYPYFLSFPEALEFNNRYMYAKDDVLHASKKIMEMINKEPKVGDFDWVYDKYDMSWLRMLYAMVLKEVPDDLTLY